MIGYDWEWDIERYYLLLSHISIQSYFNPIKKHERWMIEFVGMMD